LYAPNVANEPITAGTELPDSGSSTSLFSAKRLERHFNIITYTNLGKDSITQIFSKIIVAFLAGFSEAIAKSLDNVVEAT
jgi:hypothetical protein